METMKETKERLRRGEHIWYNGFELYMSYIESYWVRKEALLYGEQAWEYKPFKDVESALEYMGYPMPKQMSLI